MAQQVAVVVVAAGAGRRLGAGENKVFLPLGERLVLTCALTPFAAHPSVGEVVVVLAAGEERRFRAVLAQLAAAAPVHTAGGGPTRQASVQSGLRALRSQAELVLVHDGARPFVSAALIERVLEATRLHGAALPGLPLEDSLKRVDEGGRAVGTPDRQGLYRAQTPQGFRREVLTRALAAAQAEGRTFHDDAGAVAHYTDVPVHLVPGDPRNFKLTTPLDLQLAREIVGQGLAST